LICSLSRVNRVRAFFVGHALAASRALLADNFIQIEIAFASMFAQTNRTQFSAIAVFCAQRTTPAGFPRQRQ
jgi:hypothetical protein